MPLLDNDADANKAFNEQVAKIQQKLEALRTQLSTPKLIANVQFESVLTELKALSKMLDEVKHENAAKEIQAAIEVIEAGEINADALKGKVCANISGARFYVDSHSHAPMLARQAYINAYIHKDSSRIQKRPVVIKKSKKDVALSLEEKKLQVYALAKIAADDINVALVDCRDGLVGPDLCEKFMLLKKHLTAANGGQNFDKYSVGSHSSRSDCEDRDSIQKDIRSVQPQQLAVIAKLSDDGSNGGDPPIRDARTVIKKLLRVASKTTNVGDKRNIAKVALQEYIAVTKKGINLVRCRASESLTISRSWMLQKNA